MNKLFTFLIIFFPFSAFSQLTVSTEYMEIFSWDEDKDEWGEALLDYEKYAFFEFNKDMTFLDFTTNNTKTSYVLKDSEYIEEYDHYSYKATSSGGLQSVLILDLKAEKPNIRFINSFDDMTLLIRYKCKYYWFEDDK